jgi:hypothetical protein
MSIEYKERRRKYMREYYAKNKDKMKTIRIKHITKNKEKHRLYMKEYMVKWREKNKDRYLEKQRERQRQLYIKNKEKIAIIPIPSDGCYKGPRYADCSL